ncbi:hypothetical protein KL86PLE_90625 [uncultured Pleomorphomonas sp.]|uniref:Uncharacterized protein n=1 Tax=uncultured Pleomorphomonas sp. TaxID=442121 RepID=A0A212LQN6_9HYPH|nr:hypothetical protein KL86PLE_90625 [uncultured Pleomorphomonas sp.]
MVESRYGPAGGIDPLSYILAGRKGLIFSLPLLPYPNLRSAFYFRSGCPAFCKARVQARSSRLFFRNIIILSARLSKPETDICILTLSSEE